MQRPAEVRWDQPRCIGDKPSKRSGHSFVEFGAFIYMFGGCVAEQGSNQSSGPTSDLYKLDVESETEYYWTRLKPDERGAFPLARWHHTATRINSHEFVIFGGFSSEKERPWLNDSWIFDIRTEKWSPIPVSGKNTMGQHPTGFGNRVETPCPRGSHSACAVRDFIFMYGGLGGLGFSRRDFSDLHALSVQTWEWYEVETHGPRPQPRSGHKSVSAEGYFYVIGGWNCTEQFDDVHLLHEDTLTWTQPITASGPNQWGPKRWNFTAVSVAAVPYSKIFIFGGISGELDSTRPQGQYCDDLMVLDVHTVSWRKTAYVGDLPSSRADTEMIYCANFGKLILFGGWSSRWHDDVCTCDVSQIVGPPYTISAIEPSEWKSSIGPITGSTSMILKGTGFLTYVGTPACVRFACHKGFVDVSGVVVDNETISTRTPNYEKFGPVKAEISLKLGSHSFTNVTLDFNYFSVTDSSKTVAFGPGLLSNMRIGCVEKFFIQAKDKNGHDRVCGMDDFRISIGFLGDIETVKILHTLKDQGDGTYLVEYRPALPGSYKIDVEFCGTFGSRAGAICGSPFQAHTSTDQNPDQNDLDGMSMQTHIAKTINQIKENSMNICRGLNSTVSNDNIKSLISVKESLKTVHECMSLWDSTISSNRAALNYCKRMNIRFPKLDATLRNLEAVADNWAEAKVLAESVVERIASIDRDWTEKVKLQVDSYLQDLTSRKVNFRALPIWSFIEEQSVDGYDRNDQFQSMRESISREATILSEFTYLSSMFDLADTIMPCILLVDEMKQELDELMNLLKVYDNLKEYVWAISSCKWDDVDIEVLELGLKAQMKDIKKVHKCIHWSDAYKLVEKKCKDLTVSIPLVGLLKSDAMCERHWAILYEATNCVNSASPLLERNFTLGHILSMNIHMFIAEVEDITDRAMKEQKMEITIIDIRERWSNITFISTGSNEGIALLGISEDDYETLESDLLTLQGMLASRYLSYFEENVNTLNKELFNVNEVYASVLEIQRTWSYLEPLFVQSEEVKLELPEDTMRFAAIDLDFRSVLKTAWSINCVKIAFNQNGLQEVLDGVLEQLDMCKKSLSDFLDGRRRQFPRYYFVSEADLLDILSNGNNPEQILVHIPKVFLATKSINFSETDQSPCGRPIAHEFISGVGSEACKFEPPVPLVGKVEIYMQSILDGQKLSLFRSLERSLVRYHQQSRVDWILAKDHVLGRALDPAQITLLVAAINYVDEVETAFECMRTGEATSFSNLANKHMQQLGDLIDRTRSNLTNGERSRLMACITMDAHSRDIIDRIIREKVQSSDSFIWQSQLKHKYRFPPPHARHQDRDNKLRGPTGERAEIAICDAILPYDYEYLGNGPRLVVTPLTDRIYVTATQALNLNLGCAPAGPAGTGKTETTKDLANALAKLIYVINCSPEMDYKGLGNIFKGVASSGAWVCFDEFNRLVPEVLSVCTVQYKAVCDGIAASAVRIRVEGDEIRLDRTCGAFITMNPGYLGRSELPEGLKALFRPMTVMVPDLILICENMLMAEGFVTAKALASKFFCLYSLLKALLSPQLHYDWGLRAIKSVLVVAGSFKRAEPNLPEDALLMRALRDFNMPKIAKEDEVVFFGLLSDLFPGIDPPRRRDERLESYVRTACDQLGNHPDETFCLKVIQLEELLAIRHCVFIMGPAGAGKSQCWRTLKEARDLRDPSTITKVVDLNPKAVKTEELYGYISMATREWKDGLLSSIMRSLSSIPDEKPKWILLDGDLDAHWIESMNSVMDDNKMLTLASNERIPLHAHMRMIFEIRDLKHATPATVSRAGILYISTDRGTQRQSIVSSWIKRLACNRALADAFRQLFLKYVDESLNWLNINVKPIVPIDDINRVQTLINMLDTYHLGSEPQSLSNMRSIESMFVYCSVWAFGSTLCTLDDGHDYRKLFSDWWRETFRDIKFPSRDTVFDYWLDPDTMTFEPWTKSPYFYSVNYDSRITLMNQVTVPTPELCSISFWLNALVKREKALMLVGPAGTGKTQLVKGLLNNLKPATYRNATINFNYYTTASVLANTMSVSLEKKTGSNYGPPGNTKLIYFIDDLNLPELDPYNTQSAIAHLRQHIEYGHCYDLNKLTIKNISNTQIVACMNPSAGSFVIDPRLQRWFATFSVGIPDSTSLLTIYQTFLDGHLSSFSDDVKSISNNIIKAALGLHNLVSSNFKKTAVNFHYEFNLRHVSNVFEGLLVSQPERYSSVEKVILLWLHESERVYGDRLVTSEDLSKYHSLVQVHCKKLFPSFPIAKYYAKENPEPLMFCNFVEGVGSSAYDRVTNLTLISSVLEEALCEYNSSHATLDLVLFEDAIKHVARIVRVLRRPSGHVLLIGVGGSGKQSLSRLAAFLCGYTLMQITIGGTYSLNDFKEDLKIMYNRAGVKGEGVVFLLTDSQITNERFLVYINELLASGYIPDLFSSEDVDSIVSAVSSRVKSLGIVPDKENCWEFFTKEAKKNLHVCLCFSPVGDSFRNRAMRFPAVVNCTVIDIFHPWPREALYSVGRKFLADVDLGNSEQRDVIERFLPYCFDRVNKVSSDFRIKERRYVYTTPKSYLEMIKLYRHLLEDKRKTASTAIQRLENGLLKLRLTCESVAKLEESLKAMVEDAANKKEEAERIAELVLKEKAVAEQESLKALIEQAEVAKITEEVTQKQRDTEEDLRKAEPAVEAAMQALDTLDQKDLTNCKGMLKPPPKLDEVFAATMCLLAGIMPSVVVQKNGKVKDTSWDAAKKQLMGNVKEYMSFLKEIKVHVDNGTINHNNFKEVRQYLDKDYFNVETMKTKNPAAAGLCSFVLNIVQYYDIVVTVEPKRKALLDANQQLEEATRKLEEVMRTVNELEGKLLKLTSDLEEANTKKLHAMESVTKGKQQLNLAQRLTAALGSENGRWEENVTFLQQTAKKLPGDVLLASAFISYLGPFTKQFRIHLMDQMFKPHLLTEFTRVTKDSGSIPMSNNSDLLKILSTDAEIAQWNADSLPSDPVSIENGAIVCNSSRWPLIIDPQLQGIRWIKTKESNRGRHLEIVRLGQRDLLRKLEVALENGHSFLIENIGESIDATIMPVIQRATIKRGHRHFIKIGDKECDFHPDFRLFLHTKLSNPHFPPEIQAETTLVNFTVTTEGLEDQLLNLVVEKERPDLAALNTELVQKQNGFIIKIKELEDHILSKLASAEGDITDDVALIESLESTKKVSDDIEVQSSLARQTQAVITLTSERYRPVANRGSLLFFMMNDLVKIHSYYVYNLESFQKVFLSSIGQAQPPDILDKDNVELSSDQVQSRCLLLKDIITRTVFNYVQRGVFVSDKLTVTTLLTLRILVNEGKMGYDDLDFFLNSRTSADPGNMGPLHDWLPQGTWARIKGLESITKFKGIGDQIQSESDEWQVWYDSENPESSRLPGDYERTLSQFERMILLRAMRPDRLLSSLTMFIANTLGKEFIIQKPFNIELTVNESSKNTPVFFVLFPGVDPTPWVEALGKKRGKTYENKLFINISMGQGQESKAESIIRKFSHDGGWVMLQNCHLMSSWVPQLERLLEIVCDNAHEDFRCFISAEPPPLPTLKNMPESLMQSCIKVANEAPSDIKSNLLRSWDSFSQDTIDQCRQPDQMKACLFSLCWFHAVVIGRKRFGQQGWSRKYSFNTGDLLICANVLKSYLDACKVVPWDDLRYIFGEIMYGGHITDAWDRRTCNAYLQAFQNDNLFQDLELGIGFKSPRPNAMTYSSYVKYIEEVMPPESPSLLGLHPNAEIGYLTASAENLLANITALDNGDANGNDEKGYGDSVRSIMSSLLEKLPKRFDMITLSAKAAQMLSGPSGPYIVVALQECSRMNLLLNEIERSLMELEKGLKGQLNISQEMEDLAQAIRINQWPGRNVFSKCSWERLAWPSQKSLLSQFSDMLLRIEQLVQWTENLIEPKSIWLPGLFNPSSYLTATQQVCARKSGLALDKMTMETHVTTFWDHSEITDYAHDGTYIHGLYIEGARWPKGDDAGEISLIEGTKCAGFLFDSKPKELTPLMPVIYVRAVPVQDEWEATPVGYLRGRHDIYECPVYYTSFRGPTYIFLATLKTIAPPRKWILSGCALLLQIDN